jgi:large subunit ribosomal protein L20
VRVKRSLHGRKKRRATIKLAKGYYGEAHANYRRAKEAWLKAERYAYRDRRNRKRDLRRLWIVRINAAARQHGLNYSQLINGLKGSGIDLNRKLLAELAATDPEAFAALVERARASA